MVDTIRHVYPLSYKPKTNKLFFNTNIRRNQFNTITMYELKKVKEYN